MYKLYYSPGACSLAVHAMLIELGQDFTLVKKTDVADYKTINPTGAVPVLDNAGELIREGAAITLHLLEKHDNNILPENGAERTNALQWLMIANATMHPAYGRLFFISGTMEDGLPRTAVLEEAARAIEQQWKIIDTQLGKTQYVSGNTPSAADYFLATYANWGQFFPLTISLGENVRRMLNDVTARPSFQKALAAEQVEYKAAA